jgi:hypothetical protein
MAFEYLQAWILFQALLAIICYKFLGINGLIGTIAGGLLYVLTKIIFTIII